MKGKKKGVLLVLMLMSVFMLLPLGASAAKLNMTTPLKYAKRGYKIIAWNKSNTSRAYVYQQANFKNGTYGSLEKGGGIVVNMSRVNYQTRNMKNKQLTWIPVYLHNNKQANGVPVTGYVNAKNIALTAVNINNASSNSTVRTAINYGYKYLGTRFILGGSSITNGIDCATFTKQIYEAAGKAMPYPHTDWLQSVSRPVSYRDLKPGDLVFYLKYDTSGPIDHVGVYIGNNLMINASGHYGKTYPEGGITIKRIVYGNRRPALYKRLYGID